MPDRPAPPADPERPNGPVPSGPEAPPGHRSTPDAPAEPPGAEATGPEGATEATEPSLRQHVAARWAMAPPALRWGGVVVLAVVLGVLAFGRPVDEQEGPGTGDVQREAAQARAEWAALRRRAPEPVADRPVGGTLESGDAERADGRFVDYYAYTTTDSTAFSVLVTSDGFPPDLSVRTPGGRTVAASNLLRTRARAEVDGLVGPGRFEVAVTSREPGQTGAYEVVVVPAGPVDSLYVDEDARADTLGRGLRRSGRFERIYGIVASPEAPVVIRVVSEAFAPRVSLLGPNGEVVGNWRTVERLSDGAGLHAVLVRYLPGWEAPYRLIVSSETPGGRGPFAIEARTIVTRDLRADGRAVRGRLGDESWLEGGRYVDFYRFRAREGDVMTIEARSDDVPPALRLWRLDRRERTLVAEALNASGANAATIEKALDGGDHILAVTSGGEVEDSTRARGGEYTLALEVKEPEAGPAEPGASWFFTTDARRIGTSGGHTFEVVVTTVAVSYPGGDRTRVQLSVAVRSVDYTGGWAPWQNFAEKAYVVDDTGRRYRPAPAESASPSGPTAEPGTVRRGTVVFYTDGAVAGQRRFVLVASVGENTVTIPISVP